MDGGPAGDVAVSPEGPVADGVVAEGREAPGLPGAVQPPVAIPLFCFKEVFGNQPWTTPVQVISLSSVEKKRPHFELDPNLPTLQPDENGFVFAADLESALAGSDLTAAGIPGFFFLPVGAFPTTCPAPPAPPMMTREVPVVPYARVSGRVVDDRGIPLREAEVNLATRWQMVRALLEQKDWPGMVPPPIPLVTDASGRFEAAGLFPGDFTVAQVRHAESLDLDQALNLVAGDNEVELVVRSGSWIRIGISVAGFPVGTDELVWVALHHHTPGPPGVRYGFVPAQPVGWTLIPPGGDFLFGPLEAGHYDVGYQSRAKKVTAGYLGHFRVLDLGPGETRNLGIIDTQGARRVDVCVVDDETSKPVAGVQVRIMCDTPWSSLSPNIHLLTDEEGCVSVLSRTQFFMIHLTGTPADTRIVGPPYNYANRGKLDYHEFRLEKHVIPKIPIEIVGPPELHEPEFLATLDHSKPWDRDPNLIHVQGKTLLLSKNGWLENIGDLGRLNLKFPEPGFIRRDTKFLAWTEYLLVNLIVAPNDGGGIQRAQSIGRSYWGYSKLDPQVDKITIEVKKAGRLIAKVEDRLGHGNRIMYGLFDTTEGKKISDKYLGGSWSGFHEYGEASPAMNNSSLSWGEHHPGQDFEITFCPPIGRVELWIQYNTNPDGELPSRYFTSRFATIEDLGWRTLDLGTIVVGE